MKGRYPVEKEEGRNGGKGGKGGKEGRREENFCYRTVNGSDWKRIRW